MALGGALRREAVRNGAELVVANSLRSALALALTRKPRGVRYVYYLRVDMDRSKMSRARWVLLNGFVLPRFDGFISNSRWTESTIPSRFLEKPRRVAYPVSGTVNASVPARPSHEATSLTVLSLNRVVEWKGLHVLVEAVQILVDEGFRHRVNAVIAGGTFHEDEAYAARLEHRALAEKLPISFLGHQADVAPLLGQSDVVVSCSLVAEPFGQVVVQGLAAGRPVIVTNSGGPREMITDGENGVVVEPGDARALARALRRLAESSELRDRMGAAARRSAERFSDERTTEELVTSLSGLREDIAAQQRIGRRQ